MTEREKNLLKENEILRQQVKKLARGKSWIGLEEAARLCGVGISTLRRWCAEGRIDPRCGIKMGKGWRFKGAVLLAEGILLKD